MRKIICLALIVEIGLMMGGPGWACSYVSAGCTTSPLSSTCTNNTETCDLCEAKSGVYYDNSCTTRRVESQWVETCSNGAGTPSMGCKCTDTNIVISCSPNCYKSSASGCSACPDDGKSLGLNSTITSCYVTSGRDTSGTFEYTEKCYYTN